MFTGWAKIDVVREGWLKYGPTFSQRFRNFVESPTIGLPPTKTDITHVQTKALLS